MRIFDINDNEINNPDLSLGYLKDDKIFVKYHDAIEPVEEQWHYEIVAEYPNGGKDVEKVIDVVGVAAQEAWIEYEDIKRYIEYTAEELEELKKKQENSTKQRLEKLELLVSQMMSQLGVATTDEVV
jgi:hypothetical protein